MHQPHAEPRQSIYYDYQVFDAWLPSAHPEPGAYTTPVVIAGAACTESIARSTPRIGSIPAREQASAQRTAP